MKEQFKKFINKMLWIGIALFSLRCIVSLKLLVSDFSVYDIFGYAGEAIGVTAVIMGVYEKWLWKLNPLEDTPVLKREYIGTIKSTYDNIEREAKINIKQSLLSIHVVLTSGESKSQSISSSIDEVFGAKQLTYCYLNTPKASYRERSEIHYGVAMICLEDPNILTGQYFSDRKTIGDMIFYSENKHKK